MPYRIVGGFRFYERAEIRDALAYLRLVQSPADDLAFERIVNTPKRGLGDKALARIHQFARIERAPLFHAASRITETDELTPPARRQLANRQEERPAGKECVSTCRSRWDRSPEKKTDSK